MQAPRNIEVLFVAGFGPIVRDASASRRLYCDILGLPMQEEPNGYLHSASVAGVKHFALWPLEQAALSCFGEPKWPATLPTPQAWIEFEVKDLEKSSAELTRQGYTLLIANRTEPWGQTVTRLLSPEGLLVGITLTPALRG